ncbi:MAG: hypothetical protein Q7U35_01460 [Methanobacteriaceae archaeon]|jgi:hypothetical protein|nr:hypothetical protein [Methanobacteriaceae archaeon]MDP2836516.1 hypothetical protein [Methanobacteriaceae archaeon]MDP3036046.1 hypothetical protein [Methanobacteriaceae archaeon]MDP3485841.1 hypothetical protein [Methanobacteriaceae archaeon]MDP3623552.1 hypothetical protein [Methanobacteriaceae archaeon]
MPKSDNDNSKNKEKCTLKNIAGIVNGPKTDAVKLKKKHQRGEKDY